ncbi:MAG: hypothetical protein HOD63_09090 [Bacteroidetes bacterium]|jgi:hypothetical protein|nr:hypothetical protein [Bacteroidota bacterium]MBT3802894.1 hypothetical protein [Bacteroidota bacterium]MBT4338732.1 hypothetical protein [Bacteroidota bacterium]MBT4729724.1 hypothetical protein [Bacteroidota bacterium]MBT4967656.1 hypothetical protein [Bacteroidota bacterium]
MKVRIKVLILSFGLLSVTVFGQADTDKPQVRKTSFFIEPYVYLGYINVSRATNPWMLTAIPSFNVGFRFKDKFSMQLGIDYYELNELRYNNRCAFYPCPNAEDRKNIDVLLDIKYKVFQRDKFSIEPFLNVYSEVLMYELKYYFHNKEIEQWESDWTPYLTFTFVSIGAYFTYSLFDKIDLFFAPNIRYDTFGARMGTTCYF